MSKKAIMLGLALVMTLGLSACGKEEGPTVEELQAENNMLIEEAVAYEEEIEMLKAKIDAISGVNESYTDINNTEFGDASLQTIADRVLFNSSLSYTGSSQAVNDGEIKITSKVSVKPNDNWVMQLKGTTLKLSHPNGINGTIKVGAIGDNAKGEVIETEMLDTFLNSMETTYINKSKIFMDEYWRGMCAEVGTTTQEGPMILKIVFMC